MHSLEPLSADEIRTVAAVLRRDHGVGERWRFASIELREPPKGEAAPRAALVVCWNRDDGAAYRAVVSPEAGRALAWERLEGIQPNLTPDEWHECDAALKRDPRVVDALARRGITDLSLVLIDVWGYRGWLVPERHRGRRIGWTDVWFRSAPGSNPYANPVNGLHFVVDLNAMELLEIEDSFTVERPRIMGEYVPRFVPDLKPRDDLAPLEIAQPAGVSFQLDGHALTWQRWSLRIGFNPREGLVLHTVGYEDGGRVRPVAHRISLAEMIVPYRDPSLDHTRRTAFDIGEWGLGFMTQSLELGCDCLGEIRYLDAVLHDTAGEPYTIANAICIHEEDDGVLWKHVDHVEGAEIRRSRRLAISFHVTVANYEYLVYWRLYQDGSVECHVRATGIMVVGHLPPGEPARWGTMVDQRTYAPLHQHFLIARLDLDVDGAPNTVHMVETVPAEDDPHRLGLDARSVPLRVEGGQDYRWETQRAWKVVNPGSLNAVGDPVAYKLVPGAALPSMLADDSPVLRVAEALRHTLWVTPYAPDERWPCGEFPNQADRDTGLPAWTAAERSIEDADVVLWYVFGINHVTRVEDWPIMPVEAISFWLRPFGFFDRNPALDVPDTVPAACHRPEPS